jgi:hypothetical protein
MHASHKKPLLRAVCAVLVLQPLLIAAAAADQATPLIDKVRNATAQYLDINNALKQGWVPATPCVSGEDTGAMGVHFILPAVGLSSSTLNAEQPTLLIYEPMSDGAMRLVGVEFIVLASNWAGSGPPALDGNLLNYIAAPNRYGLPAFYEIHVWAWQDNPKGSYADWNTRVTCVHQPN